jgi:hypothetical protein
VGLFLKSQLKPSDWNVSDVRGKRWNGSEKRLRRLGETSRAPSARVSGQSTSSCAACGLSGFKKRVLGQMSLKTFEIALDVA